MTELSRDQVLAGLHGRRSSMSLLAIQSRTALLALRARHATSPPVGDSLVERSERSFLGTVAAGRELAVTPTIFDVERHAYGWSDLVPQNAAARADLFAQLARTYRFGWGDVPRIRRVLQLDDVRGATATAWASRHPGTPRDATTPSREPLDRLRWLRVRVVARVDGLPPMLTVMSLTLANTVGASILALPIAVSAIGPLGGLIPLVVFGVLNVATAAAMAEGFARTGRVRWGNGFLRRVLEEYFGRRAATFGVSALVAFSLVAILAYYIGVSSTLEESIGLPSGVWAAVLGVVVLWFTRRRDIASTAVTAIVVVALNLTIIAVIVGLTIPSVTGSNLGRMVSPFDGGFDAAVVETVLGIVLACCGGQSAVVMSARAVMRRDPSGRSLIWGMAGAKLIAIVVYAAWLLAIGGAVDPAELAGETGTVLVPLADAVGPAVLVLGSIYAVAAMGMGTVQQSVALAGQASEWTPAWFPARKLIGTAVAMSPCVVGFVLLATDRASFTHTIAIIGVLAVPVLAGLAPIGVLVASRRRGRYQPAGSVRWFGSPVAAVAIVVVYVGATALHVVVWQELWERALALIVTAMCCVVTWAALRSGRLRPLAVVELRREPLQGWTSLGIAARGEPARVVVDVGPRGKESTSEVAGESTFPVTVDRVSLGDIAPDLDLSVWTHAIDPVGMSRPLRATVRAVGGAVETAVASDSEGYACTPAGGAERTVEIVLDRDRR